MEREPSAESLLLVLLCCSRGALFSKLLVKNEAIVAREVSVHPERKRPRARVSARERARARARARERARGGGGGGGVRQGWW